MGSPTASRPPRTVTMRGCSWLPTVDNAAREHRGIGRAGRTVRASAARQLARGPPRARRRPVRVYVPEPQPLPVAVVLGLVLQRDRVAALRSRLRAPRTRVTARRAARRRVHRTHDLLEHAADGHPPPDL